MDTSTDSSDKIFPPSALATILPPVAPPGPSSSSSSSSSHSAPKAAPAGVVSHQSSDPGLIRISAKPGDKVFEDVSVPSSDIGSIVSQRLAAMKKLSHNPNNPEALQEMYEAQKQMSTWAQSKNKPGQFTGLFELLSPSIYLYIYIYTHMPAASIGTRFLICCRTHWS